MYMTTMIYLLLTFKEYSFDSGQQRINVTLKNVTESIKIQQFILHGDHDIKIYDYMTIIFKKNGQSMHCEHEWRRINRLSTKIIDKIDFLTESNITWYRTKHKKSLYKI